ncbi:MAG TPA: SRPBCC family protein [Gemmatimonadaceae bacterium]|nr:SRPBCC family protein [Gemmatimonadaceae bacterium]
MKKSGKLKVTAEGDREIVMTRVFNAPREMVFEAWTNPELVKRWLLGPPGWSMPVCEINAKQGGKYRYVWQHDTDGTQMGISGTYIEVKRPERIVSTERFDEAWYPGEGRNTLVLVEQNGETTMTATSRYESRAARDAVLKTGMESGVRDSYDRLEKILESSAETAGASR